MKSNKIWFCKVKYQENLLHAILRLFGAFWWDQGRSGRKNALCNCQTIFLAGTQVFLDLPNIFSTDILES